jgi:DHA3 family macrolide efflux protein-like MFS transporter
MKKDFPFNWKRQITIFLLGQNISLFGSALVQYAIMWHITMTTQSGVMMSLSIVCGFLPTFFISPFAGVWADRYNRKKIIVLSDALVAISTLVLAILYALNYQHISLLLIVLAIRAIGGGIQKPAVNAFIPDIVPTKQLLTVNGYNSSFQSVSNVASPIMSGLLLSVSPLSTIFFIDVITATIAIFLLVAFVRVSFSSDHHTEHESSLAEIKLGLRYIKSHKMIKTLFFYLAAFYIVISPLAFLSPLQVSRSFGNDVWRLTAIEVLFSLGMIIGGLLIALWGKKIKNIHIIKLSLIMFTLTTLALALVGNFYLYLAFLGFSGIAMPFFDTPLITILQQEVNPTYMGRVFSVAMMISSVFMPLSMILYGPLADIISIETILLITTALMAILTVSMLLNKTFRKGKISPNF